MKFTTLTKQIGAVLALAVSASTTVSTIIHSPVAWAGCTVTQDNYRTYTDTSVISCTDYYPPNHFCASASRSSDNACKALDMFLAVDWTKADLINNVHRGIWG